MTAEGTAVRCEDSPLTRTTSGSRAPPGTTIARSIPMTENAAGMIFGAVLVVVLGLVLLLGCTAGINPDVSRFGDAAGRDATVISADGSVCPAPRIICGEVCVDASADPAHCGGCGMACAAASQCISGVCVCPPGDPSCGDIGDPDRCGGRRCADERYCSSGSCVCRPGLTDVSGTCLDLQTDPQNCGAPGQRCDGVCSGGRCARDCPAPRRECNGGCVDLQTDPLNCGDCGNTCDRDELCINGRCRGYQGAPTCAACRGEFPRCCGYGAGGLVCVDADGCP